MDDECKILTELRALVKSSSTMFTYKFIRKCQMFAYILNVKVNSQVSEFDGNPKKKVFIVYRCYKHIYRTLTNKYVFRKSSL